MKIERKKISNIPSIIWGEKSSKVFIAIHGNMSNKEDKVIEILANKATTEGYQVISFDLPEHGERKNNIKYLCKAQNCVNDLKKIMNYVKRDYKEISIWACSMGAYFSLLAYQDESIKKCLFLSPIVDMLLIIKNMMLSNNVTEKQLQEKQEISTNFGQTLYWDYYSYVKEHPVTACHKNTSILYGSNDNMQEEDIIKNFSKRFNCNLEILENGEHYFHTGEQLKYYKDWLNKTI